MATMDIVLVDRNGYPLKTLDNGHLGTFQHLPDYADLVAEGKVWSVQDLTTATIGAAPPTGTAGLTIQNPADSGVYYVVFMLTGIIDANPASLASATLWHCAHKLAVAALSRDISLQATGAGAVNGMRAGQGAYGGVAILDRGATVIDDGWAPVGDMFSNVVNSQADYAVVVELPVPVVVPPSFHYSMHAVGSGTTALGHGLIWAEVSVNDLQ